MHSNVERVVVQRREFLLAGGTRHQVTLNGLLFGCVQLTEQVIFQIERCARHSFPRISTDVSVSFRRSKAVYKRDFTVETGQPSMSAISSNLKP